MKINRLRSIIKEAVDAQLKEIEAVAENAAMEARLAEYDKAIKTCEIKIETAENLEEVKDLMDEGKINELKKKLKSLTKAKEKLEKAKAKKNKGKEVVTDEPVEDTVDEGSYYDEAESDDAAHIDALEKDMEDDAMNNEVALNESFLKMQKLAGVITEAQYNEKKSLTEDQVEEGAVIDTALGVAGGLVGLWALLKGGAVVAGVLGNTAINIVDRMADKAKAAAMKAKKEGRLDTIKPIIAKFEDDEELKNMYQNLTPKDNGFSAKTRENNALRTKQLQAIAKYIKSKLTPEEMEYFTDVSSMMRTGDIA
jgi:hypothetical protein